MPFSKRVIGTDGSSVEALDRAKSIFSYPPRPFVATIEPGIKFGLVEEHASSNFPVRHRPHHLLERVHRDVQVVGCSLVVEPGCLGRGLGKTFRDRRTEPLGQTIGHGVHHPREDLFAAHEPAPRSPSARACAISARSSSERSSQRRASSHSSRQSGYTTGARSNKSREATAGGLTSCRLGRGRPVPESLAVCRGRSRWAV